MRIGFPWATRCPVCIFEPLLDWPRHGRAKHRGQLLFFFFFKVGGTGLSSSAHNISNASNVPKQKEVAWKDAIAGCALMFSCHSCSSLVSISSLKPSATYLLQLIPPPSMHSDIHGDPVALSPRPNSSINRPVKILAHRQVNCPRAVFTKPSC